MRVFSFQQIPQTPEMTKKRKSGSGWVGEKIYSNSLSYQILPC